MILYMLTESQLLELFRNKRLQQIYYFLLSNRSWSNRFYFKSYEALAKRLGYTNRSGIWKSLRKLETIGLIQIEFNIINLNNRGSFTNVTLPNAERNK